MAVLWQKQVGETCYEVRSAGNTRRLYSNGVFHSQYNPGHGVTGSVWDLLMLPALFYPQGSLNKVLVLGVGGGAVIQMLRRFVAPRSIVGVELSAVHLQLARRFFGVKGQDITLHHAEAQSWLENYDGPPFDMIIDDVFGEAGGEPVRAIPADRCWVQLLLRHLAPNGVVVSNFPGPYDLKTSAYVTSPGIASHFKASYHFSCSKIENAVGAFFRVDVDSKDLDRHRAAYTALDTRRKGCRLRYRMRRLS